MRTRELVDSLAQHAYENAALPPARQHEALVADRARVGTLLAAKGDGPVAMVAKPVRLSDKVVERTVQLGGPTEAANGYLRRLGLVRGDVPRRSPAPESAVPPTLLSGVTEAAVDCPGQQAATVPATSPVGGAHPSEQVYSFRARDGAVVAIERGAVDASGSTMLAAMLHGPMADAPGEDGHWPMLGLSGHQLELVKQFCEGGLCVANLQPAALQAASAAGDYLDLQALEAAVEAELSHRP